MRWIIYTNTVIHNIVMCIFEWAIENYHNTAITNEGLVGGVQGVGRIHYSGSQHFNQNLMFICRGLQLRGEGNVL